MVRAEVLQRRAKRGGERSRRRVLQDGHTLVVDGDGYVRVETVVTVLWGQVAVPGATQALLPRALVVVALALLRLVRCRRDMRLGRAGDGHEGAAIVDVAVLAVLGSRVGGGDAGDGIVWTYRRDAAGANVNGSAGGRSA